MTKKRKKKGRPAAKKSRPSKIRAQASMRSGKATTKKQSKLSTKKARSRKKRPKKLSKVELLEQKVASLTKRLRKYERNKFIGPLPEGKKRKPPSRTEIDKHRNELKLFFEGVKRNAEAQNVSSKYRSYENADGSIDAELRIPVENSGDVEGMFIDIEDSGDWNSLTDYWIMIGLNAGAEDVTGSPTIDKRPHRAWTNPVRGHRSGAAFFTARETVVKKLEQYGAEFTMIVIRVYYSPYNDRPNRPRK